MRYASKRSLGALIAVAVLLAAAPSAVAAQDDGVPGDADLDALVDVYNANVDEAPGIARGQFAGQRIEFRYGNGSTVAAKDAGTAYHFTTASDGTITDYGAGAAEDPTIRVRTSETAFRAVFDAEDPAAEFDRQYEAGNVEVNGLSVTNAVKVELAKFAVWLGKTFGLF